METGTKGNLVIELQRLLASSGYEFEYDYVLDKLNMLAEKLNDTEIDKMVEAEFLGFERVIAEENEDYSSVLEEALATIKNLRSLKREPLQLSKDVQQSVTKLTNGVYGKKLIEFFAGYTKQFGKKDNQFTEVAIRESFLKDPAVPERDNALAQAIADLEQLVEEDTGRDAIERLDSLLKANQVDKIDQMSNLIDALGMSAPYLDLMKSKAKSWMNAITNQDPPEVFSSKLNLMARLVDHNATSVEDEIAYLVSIFPFAGQTQMREFLEAVEGANKSLSTELKAKLFNLFVTQIEQFAPGDDIRALGLVSPWIDLVDQEHQTALYTHVSDNFDENPHEYLKILSPAWKVLELDQVENLLVTIYQTGDDEGIKGERIKELERALNRIKSEDQKVALGKVWNELYSTDPSSAHSFLEDVKNMTDPADLAKLREEAIALIRSQIEKHEFDDDTNRNLDFLDRSTRIGLRDNPILIDMFAELFGEDIVSIKLALTHILPALANFRITSEHRHMLADAMGKARKRIDDKQVADDITEKAKRLGLMWWTYREHWED